MRWQNALTVALLEAQLIWTKEDCCSDAPLQTFAKIFRRNSLKPLLEDRISVVAASTWIASRIYFFDKSNTNVDDYDAFVDYLKRYYQEDQSGSFTVGLLEFVHPTNRRPDTLLNSLRDAKDSEEEIHNLTLKPEGQFKLAFRHLVYYCHSIGRTADLRWLIDFFGDVQRERQRLNVQGAGGRDPLSKRVSRKPSKRELAKDIEVGPDGSLMTRYTFTETLQAAQQREKKLASKARSPLEQPLHSSRAAADTTSEQKHAPVREGSVTYRPYH